MVLIRSSITVEMAYKMTPTYKMGFYYGKPQKFERAKCTKPAYKMSFNTLISTVSDMYVRKEERKLRERR